MDQRQVFDFVGYQFNLKEGKVRPTLEDLECKNPDTSLGTHLPGVAADVPDRVTNSHREASQPRSSLYETNTMALEKTGGYQRH